jgi:hypothetical protein
MPAMETQNDADVAYEPPTVIDLGSLQAMTATAAGMGPVENINGKT